MAAARSAGDMLLSLRPIVSGRERDSTAMTVKAYADHNPFLFFAGVFGAVVVAKRRLRRSHGLGARCPSVVTALAAIPPVVVKALLLLMWLSIAWFFVFEAYYSVYRCAVSARYHDETILIARSVITLLEEHNVPYWMDYATLLAVIRGQSINEWDHDTDISIVFPDDGPAALIAAINAAGMYAVWDDRDAIQIMPYEGANPLNSPHMDIWFWREEKLADGSRVVSTAYDDVAYRKRAWDDIFPLKAVAWKAWPGHDIYIPADAHGVSQKEFGAWPGSYMTPVVYKGDCFHNWFQRRWLY
ncbi:uncharacterized protein AMSG_08804 [Thecamonas trahens ATCC 50062]|uniref:LicD family protein n=1 Tax=Thecamonas trahens ATCC 50062 TaxID=461836 RepID=A0A0L0DLW4_THETB|nr:hypothetical protein AMSG_08804 [Thecamonas trahens ATCC 50062]KNC53309.1 hypothetical protein AMSG_08804 [Thecamonas trahens ATCC 50062]|eukprot:XP_013754570.1 hypothetical protein AMSG_08804 [Thecamonas trahens ATCC 50062]